MTHESILVVWKEAGEALGSSRPAANIPYPLDALSWAQRAANGHRPSIERVLSVVRFAPAPNDLNDQLALAICNACAQVFEPEEKP